LKYDNLAEKSQKMKANLFKALVFVITSFLFISNDCLSQFIILPEGDTLMVVSENGTISDISGNYMGKFESDGTVLNGQNLLVGKNNPFDGKIFNSLEDEVAFIDGNNVFDYDSTLLASIVDNSIYDAENNLIARFSNLIAIRAVFLMMFYF
jgi:hypothetical protein